MTKYSISTDNSGRICGVSPPLNEPVNPMSVSLSDIRIPRGRLLMIENGVEIEILKREMPEGESQP